MSKLKVKDNLGNWHEIAFTEEIPDISGKANITYVDEELENKQDKLPIVTNDRYLHTNVNTGALEWSLVTTEKTKYQETEPLDWDGIWCDTTDEHNYLCFTGNPSVETNGVSTIFITTDGHLTTTPTLEYSLDKKNWVDFIIRTTTITLNEGDKVYFRGDNSSFNTHDGNIRFYMTGSISANGNIMSLLDKTCESLVIPNDYCFYNLFAYSRSLTSAPELPATTLTPFCYSEMFYNCTSLTTAPELPATELAEGCYRDMFNYCDTLEVAPELPATTLVNLCYNSMFAGCTNLNHIKVNFTDWSPSSATGGWVSGVSSTGIFECPADLPNITGPSKIPSNWTVQTF